MDLIVRCNVHNWLCGYLASGCIFNGLAKDKKKNRKDPFQLRFNSLSDRLRIPIGQSIRISSEGINQTDEKIDGCQKNSNTNHIFPHL